MKKLIFSIILILLLSNIFVLGQHEAVYSENKNVNIVMFYGEGCPHCSALRSFLGDLKKENTNLIIEEYEIYFSNENRELFEELSKAYDSEIQGVPTTFIGDKILIGYNNQIGNEIKQEIIFCQEQKCVNPKDKIKDGNKDFKTLTIPVVFSASIVDAINPCAFAVLIILLTTILASDNKKRALYAGLFFSLSIFISYFLMGLGLYSAIQASGFIHSFYIIVAILAIIIGLFNLKDFFWYGKWFVMEVPLKWRPKMKLLIKNVTSVPGAFFIGFVVSLFLLPCTSGPYIVILGLLANTATRVYATLLLVLYNIIFILPMLLITFGIYFGITTTEEMESWRTRKLKTLHLITGFIILLLGIGMLLSLYLGWI